MTKPVESSYVNIPPCPESESKPTVTSLQAPTIPETTWLTKLTAFITADDSVPYYTSEADFFIKQCKTGNYDDAKFLSASGNPLEIRVGTRYFNDCRSLVSALNEYHPSFALIASGGSGCRVLASTK